MSGVKMVATALVAAGIAGWADGAAAQRPARADAFQTYGEEYCTVAITNLAEQARRHGQRVIDAGENRIVVIGPHATDTTTLRLRAEIACEVVKDGDAYVVTSRRRITLSR